LVLLLQRAVERKILLEENILLKEEFAERLGFPRIIGDSEPLQQISGQIQKAAPTGATILLQGESGTGKELFARAIHHLSPRKDAPFVAINCAAIPENLLENELFGHEKGAYTGADSARAGRMELADGGTLFLDEIGELGAGVQAKLLRVLQEKSFERVGGRRTIKVDIRVVAATNRDLESAVGAGEFREDLYFRLAVVTMTVPPLRERKTDLEPLAGYFLERFSRELGREDIRFSESARAALEQHPWPGNIRELENAVERAVILADSDLIQPEHLGMLAPGGGKGDEEAFCRAVGLEGSLDEVAERARNLAERTLIARALKQAGGNKTKAAQALRVNYKRLLSRIRDLGLDR
jgi:transcriptional regulator with GAF, ATPase, and Fis domain